MEKVKELERLLVSINDLIEEMNDEELQNFLLTSTYETEELDLRQSIGRVQHNIWVDLGRPKYERGLHKWAEDVA